MHITDTVMTSTDTPHTAVWRAHAAANGQGAWVVSWLPEQPLDRNEAITAMTVAEFVATGARPTDRAQWAHVEDWASELGIAVETVVTRLVGSN
jgi:hypothetical protein